MYKDYQQYIVNGNLSLIHCLKKMNEVKHKSLLIFEGKEFKSIITIGDIQRAIIKGHDLNTPIEEIVYNTNKEYAKATDSIEDIRNKIFRLKAEFMPILDTEGRLIRIYTWSDFFVESSISKKKINLPVIIMAGGKGTRLKPLTNVFPKPLIPIGEKTILEEIMDRFENCGCSKFYLSVNYKSEIIRFYIESLTHKYNIEFFKEEKPLGTIGSVSLLSGTIRTPFFVTNCDILIDQDYSDVYEYHKTNKNEITIVTAIKNNEIPYGVITTSKDGLLVSIQEKPEISYMINTGVYILEPSVIKEIPKGEFFHITHLIEKVKKRGGRIGCFPVSDGAWKDMGEWDEFLKLILYKNK